MRKTWNSMEICKKERAAFRIEKYRRLNFPIAAKIYQLYGDSAKFDFSPYYNACSLVFVDGSHTYDDVLSDTREALNMVRKGGVIVWHDYGMWGVLQGL